MLVILVTYEMHYNQQKQAKFQSEVSFWSLSPYYQITVSVLSAFSPSADICCILSLNDGQYRIRNTVVQLSTPTPTNVTDRQTDDSMMPISYCTAANRNWLLYYAVFSCIDDNILLQRLQCTAGPADTFTDWSPVISDSQITPDGRLAFPYPCTTFYPVSTFKHMVVCKVFLEGIYLLLGYFCT